MTTTYNAIVELDERTQKATELDRVEQLLDELSSFSAAISASPRGRVEVVITLPAASLQQATIMALDVVHGAGVRIGYIPATTPVSVEVMTTAEFDARAGMQRLPSLIGSAEAAELLGVSRQRVTQLVEAGMLQAEPIGRSLVLARANVEAFAARDRGPGRPKSRASS